MTTTANSATITSQNRSAQSLDHIPPVTPVEDADGALDAEAQETQQAKRSLPGRPPGIRADSSGLTDRQRRVIIAEAERDAQKLRGEGDAEATRIYAGAYGRDPAFYAFHRSLESYRKAFAEGNAAIVLDENDPFLEYLRGSR